MMKLWTIVNVHVATNLSPNCVSNANIFNAILRTAQGRKNRDWMRGCLREWRRIGRNKEEEKRRKMRDESDLGTKRRTIRGWRRRRATIRHNLKMRVLKMRKRVSLNIFHLKRRSNLQNLNKNKIFLLQEPSPHGKQQQFRSTPIPTMCAIHQTRSRAGSNSNDKSYLILYLSINI